MKRAIITWIVLTVAAFNGGGVMASDESGFGSLDAFLVASHLDPGEKVLGMVGFYGQPQPVQWLILTDNPKEPGILRESVFARGRILAERKFTPLPGQDLPHLPINRTSLKVDSETAFHAAEALALKQKIAFDSAHFQLRVRDLESEPVWMLNMINTAQVSIGVVYISAATGTVLRESWVVPPTGSDSAKVSSR